MTLANYVKRRTGVALGAKGSLRNMLYRSLGAGSFAGFWRYWNPIWSYYLTTHIFKPSKQYVPAGLAIIITFTASGAIHDLAMNIAGQKLWLLFTPWFAVMGVWVVISERFRFQYAGKSWLLRVVINLTTITLCFWVANFIFIKH
ncbi:MBOAT family O-acyltransferase [Idiomarina seosinensis]|uniref:MBOAT family O-acyltransferase n=1 Tax=Idiomarina seosinensis TaxID=281739 RepID=UPI001F543FA8|nr:MBOAT family O-acyltransferase [Idiomarina seosinensis]